MRIYHPRDTYSNMIPEISASKVAGFIGLHKYQNSHEIAYELLCKVAATKAKINEIERATHRRPFNAVLNEVLKETPIADCISSGIREAQHTTNVSGVLKDVQDQAALILDLRNNAFSPELKARLADEVRGQVAKRRGINNEEKILNAYEKAKDVRVTERNTKTIKKDMGTWKLVGRCDGYVASENRIVDSKDRTRHWPQVPLYDEIQLRCYMNMYNAKESELIERFPTGETRHTLYPADPEKWATIQTAVEKGVEKLRLAMEDDEELKRIIFANTVSTVSHGDSHV
jgi:hypothetical protein